MHPLPDSFSLAGDAQAVVTRLIDTLPECAFLSEARIACVLSQRVPILHGHPCRAFIAKPHVQGPFKWLFDWLVAELTAPLFAWGSPDYLIVFDAALWPTLSSVEQECLVYHELAHLRQREDAETGVPKFGDDGRPVLTLVPHDYEFFDAEVRRYGPEVCELVDAALAIADGARRARPHRIA